MKWERWEMRSTEITLHFLLWNQKTKSLITLSVSNQSSATGEKRRDENENFNNGTISYNFFWSFQFIQLSPDSAPSSVSLFGWGVFFVVVCKALCHPKHSWLKYDIAFLPLHCHLHPLPVSSLYNSKPHPFPRSCSTVAMAVCGWIITEHMWQ